MLHTLALLAAVGEVVVCAPSGRGGLVPADMLGLGLLASAMSAVRGPITWRGGSARVKPRLLYTTGASGARDDVI